MPISDVLVNYLKKVEGNIDAQERLGHYRAGKFYPYKDPAVGTVIGYGHQLLSTEKKKYKDGITEAEATDLLLQDIAKASEHAKDHFGEKGWNEMDPHRQAMAIDFAFNLGRRGLKRFPKFSRALRNANWTTISTEYKRYYETPQGMKPMEHRNDTFYDTFIAPAVGNDLMPTETTPGLGSVSSQLLEYRKKLMDR